MFEWDPDKGSANWAKHDVGFGTASAVFKDSFAIEWQDDRMDYGEDRFIIIGMVEGRLLHVAYTMRGEAVRLISARGAGPNERRLYHEANT